MCAKVRTFETVDILTEVPLGQTLFHEVVHVLVEVGKNETLPNTPISKRSFWMAVKPKWFPEVVTCTTDVIEKERENARTHSCKFKQFKTNEIYHNTIKEVSLQYTVNGNPKTMFSMSNSACLQVAPEVVIK